MAEMEVNSIAAFSPHAVTRVIGAVFPCLTKPQKKSLSIFVTGLCKARSGIMTESARKTTGAASLRDRVKRIYRFVANILYKNWNICIPLPWNRLLFMKNRPLSELLPELQLQKWVFSSVRSIDRGIYNRY